ncbi:hypothetical protein D3C78_17050 [compost metagenome]
MSESFKYLRLEISSVLFKSWGELLSLLRRKNSRLEGDYVSFLFCGKNLLKKGKTPIPDNNHRFKCSYFIYDENDIWHFFNRSNKDKNKYNYAISLKEKFIEHLNQINERFSEEVDKNDYVFPFREKEPKTPFKRNNILQYSIPMITLNAAILEGALREILARYIQNEINLHVAIGNKTGRLKHNNYQKLLVAKQIKIESNSSFNAILTEYNVIFELSPKELIGKEIFEIVTSLLTMRNLFAHGTSIVTTNVPVENDLYFKNWNKRVEELQKILKKYFGSNNVFENISDYRLAEFYMSYSSLFLIKIAEFVSTYDESGEKAIKEINIIKNLKSENLSYKYTENFLKLYNFPKS